MGPRILLLGAGGSAGANYASAIQEHNAWVVGTDLKPYHLELAPVDARYLLPPQREGAARLEAVKRIIKAEQIEFIHAQPDPEVIWLAQNKDKLLPAVTFLPSMGALGICSNKQRCNEIWREKGVPTPAATRGEPRSRGAFAETILTLLHDYPTLWVRAIAGAGARAALPVNTVEQALHWIDYWREYRGLDYRDFMVSEFLPGPEYAFQSLWRNGKLMVSAARQRIEYVFGNLTPSGQSSSPSVAVSVHNSEVNDVATRAVEAVDPEFNGIACVDMKTNAKGGICVTEINAGRFYTTSNFFAQAGCNMPWLHLIMALGEAPPEDLPQYNAVPAGLYWVRMMDMGYDLVGDGEWTSEAA